VQAADIVGISDAHVRRRRHGYAELGFRADARFSPA
jgi:hypothetical protein